jgi:hypothetical protein
MRCIPTEREVATFGSAFRDSYLETTGDLVITFFSVSAGKRVQVHGISGRFTNQEKTPERWRSAAPGDHLWRASSKLTYTFQVDVVKHRTMDAAVT